MLLLTAGLLIFIAGRSPGLRGPAARLAAFICIAVGLLLMPVLGIPSLILVATLGAKGLLMSVGVQLCALVTVLGLVSFILKHSFLNISMKK